MGFFQALFLVGAGSAAIPVVIHLIFKARKQRLVFSSLKFLELTVLKENRRLFWREWLLLLLRCLACALLALAFARPYLGGAAGLGAPSIEQADTVLLVDDSPSLNAQEQAATRWSRQLQGLRDTLKATPAGSRVALVKTSTPGRPEVELTGNFAALESALRRLEAQGVRGDCSVALETALDHLKGAKSLRRRILYFTDGQASGVERAAWERLAAETSAQGGRTDVAIRVPSGGGEQASGPLPALGNVAITDIRPRGGVWIKQGRLPLSVRVDNFSEQDRPNLTLELTVNGKPIEQRTIGLGPRQGTQFEWAAPFDGPGSHYGSVKLQVQDALPLDDVRHFALELRDTLRCLVVDHKLDPNRPWRDDSYYVRMALQLRPHHDEARAFFDDTETGPEGGQSLKVEAIEDLRAGPEHFKTADIIILAGTRQFSDPALKALEDEIQAGKGLLVFLGVAEGEAPLAFYRDVLWKNGRGVLPTPVAGVYQGDRGAGTWDVLDAFQERHPIFEVFKGADAESLRRPRYFRHALLDKDGLTSPGRDAGTVLATFTHQNAPWLVERAFGKGAVLAFPFLPRPEDDTDFPVRKTFVPLIHQATRYLARFEAGQERIVTAGDVLALSSLGIPQAAKVSVNLPGPRNEIKELRGGDRFSLDQPGLYLFSYEKDGQTVRKAVAANLDPRESDLMTEDLSSLARLFASNAARDAGGSEDGPRTLSREEWEQLQRQDYTWAWMLLAACACLVLEVWLRDLWTR